MAPRYELHHADIEMQVLTPTSDREDGPEGLAPDTYALVIGPYSGALVVEDSPDRLCLFAQRLSNRLVSNLPSGPEPAAPLGTMPDSFSDLTLSALLATALTQITSLFELLAQDDGNGPCDGLASGHLTQLGTTLYVALCASSAVPAAQADPAQPKGSTLADLLKAAARERAELIHYLEHGDRSNQFAFSAFAACRLDLVRLHLLRAQHTLSRAQGAEDQEGHRS